MSLASKLCRQALAALALCLFTGFASAAPIEVLWLGHSTFRITSVNGKVIVIDPFLNGNRCRLFLDGRSGGEGRPKGAASPGGASRTLRRS